jgi:CRP-like cAMP-binding protein
MTIRLLAALPQATLDQLGPHLASVSLSPRQVLYKRNAPIELIYFPEQGVVSVLTVMSDGTMGEVGMIGTEGMAGAPVLLGANISAQHASCRFPINARFLACLNGMTRDGGGAWKHVGRRADESEEIYALLTDEAKAAADKPSASSARPSAVLIEPIIMWA